jgi:hypothetical protein
VVYKERYCPVAFPVAGFWIIFTNIFEGISPPWLFSPQNVTLHLIAFVESSSYLYVRLTLGSIFGRVPKKRLDNWLSEFQILFPFSGVHMVLNPLDYSEWPFGLVLSLV